MPRAMPFHQPQILSPLVENGFHAVRDTGLQGRKLSVIGNRSWSEEEEAYLLQTRLQKMPYKHIAAHLNKTELACRLHYHQLSHGSHRRRRNASISSTTTCSSTGNSSNHSRAPSRESSHFASRQGSPSDLAQLKPTSLTASSPNRPHHKPLLPKPHALTPRASPEPHPPLRINTHVAPPPLLPRTVDTDRLGAIYEARRHSFWATVAADYGPDVSPAQLEDIWRSSASVVRPPTPDASPDGSVLANPNGGLKLMLPVPFPGIAQGTAPPASQHHHPHSLPSWPQTHCATSATGRMPFVLPPPVTLVSTGRARAGTWSSAPRDHVPIASLLNGAGEGQRR